MNKLKYSVIFVLDKYLKQNSLQDHKEEIDILIKTSLCSVTIVSPQDIYHSHSEEVSYCKMFKIFSILLSIIIW